MPPCTTIVNKTTTEATLTRLTQQPCDTPLSKGQQLFQQLIKKIDGQRRQLRDWQHAIFLYEQKYASVYCALADTFNGHRTELVYQFDRAYFDAGLNMAEQNKLSEIICLMAGRLLMAKDAPAQLRDVFNRHSDVDFDTRSKKAGARVKEITESASDAEIEEECDWDDPELMLDLLRKQAEKKREQAKAAKAAAAQAGSGQKQQSGKKRAKEVKTEQEKKNISLSVRAIFRKLASALHPDKELDEGERVRKTALMQRVNVAYDKGDLLQLLELQLEIEQIDQQSLTSLNGERLLHYNQILTGQSAEIAVEINQTEQQFRLRFQIEANSLLSPAVLQALLEREIGLLKKDIKAALAELRHFKETSAVKVWLKSV